MAASPPHDTLMRAIELAKAGARPISEIQKQLSREGYSHAGGHLSGASIRKQLNALIAENR